MSALQLLDSLISELEVSINLAEQNKPKEKKSEKVPETSKKSEKKDQASSSKQPKADNKQAAKPTESNADEPLNVNAIDLRVGVIRSVEKHATAEKLYCELIDVGEAEPRAIASGLVPYYTLEQMQGRRLIVVCNLKPRNLVGFKSHGMVLCASKTNSDGTSVVEFIDPPADSQPGDRIVGLGLTGEALTPSKCDKTKAFELIAADLKVDDEGNATWKGIKLVSVSNGQVCTSPTLRDALIR